MLSENVFFLLSDEGFYFNLWFFSTVWIGNARGNTYSRRHITLDPKDPKFWDFSWHEIGVYDIPATIDYVLANTNQTKLSYVGHSQGIFCVIFIEKIKSFLPGTK